MSFSLSNLSWDSFSALQLQLNLFCACSMISLTLLFWGDISSCCHLSASGYVNSSHPWEEEITGSWSSFDSTPTSAP